MVCLFSFSDYSKSGGYGHVLGQDQPISVESPEISDHYKDAAAYIAIAKTCHEAMQDSALDWQE
jgi:hypothetical protein